MTSLLHFRAIEELKTQRKNIWQVSLFLKNWLELTSICRQGCNLGNELSSDWCGRTMSTFNWPYVISDLFCGLANEIKNYPLNIDTITLCIWIQNSLPILHPFWSLHIFHWFLFFIDGVIILPFPFVFDFFSWFLIKVRVNSSHQFHVPNS